MRFVRHVTAAVSIAASIALASCTAILGDYQTGGGDDASTGVDGAVDGPNTDGTVMPEGGGDDSPNPDGGEGGGMDAGDSGCGANQLSCNGTCVPNDTHNCGTCGHDCTNLAHVSGAVTCTAGACAFASTSCAPGFADCNTRPDDGCEADLSKTATCGNCTTMCTGGTPVCTSMGDAGTSFGCASGCPVGTPTLCSGSCVNTATNAQNCMTCGNACPMVANGQPSCSASTCGFSCNASYHVCNGACADNTSVNTCGAMCTPCVVPHAVAACTGGACAIGSCVAGYADCNTSAADGCEISTGNDVTNCGGCGNRCGSANGTAACSGGTCSIVCSAGFADCDGNNANGCEINIGTDVNHCGACPTVCSLPNATPACSAGTCRVASCTGTFHDCNGVASDGCEIDTSSNAAHCGTCPNACNATFSCVGGACTCAGALPNLCGGTCVNFQTDPANCGACGHGCLGGACAAGMCQPVTLGSVVVAGTPRGIAVEQGAVFFSGTTKLFKCNVAGCGGNPVPLSSGYQSIQAVFTDNPTGFLFAADENANSDMKVDPNNGAIVFTEPGQSNAVGLTADNSYVYFGATNNIGRASKYDGTGLVNAATGLGFVYGLFYDPVSNAVYAADYNMNAGKIVRCNAPACGNAWTALAGSQGYPTNVAVAGGNVYFTRLGNQVNYVDGGLLMVPVGGGSVIGLAIGAAYGFAFGVNVDANYAYFAGGSNIYRCALGGCGGAPTVIAANVGVARSATNDAVAVYWLTDSGTVQKVAK